MSEIRHKHQKANNNCFNTLLYGSGPLSYFGEKITEKSTGDSGKIMLMAFSQKFSIIFQVGWSCENVLSCFINQNCYPTINSYNILYGRWMKLKKK